MPTFKSLECKITSTQLERLKERDARQLADQEENLEYFQRLYARKSKKAQHTIALQQAVDTTTETAWQHAVGGLPQTDYLKRFFFEEYKNFLLGAGFKLLWSQAKRHKLPVFEGFTFDAAIKYAVKGWSNDFLPDVAWYMSRLTIGAKVEAEQVYTGDRLEMFTEKDITLADSLLDLTDVTSVISTNHLHRRCRSNATHIAKLVTPDELSSCMSKDFRFVEMKHYIYLWNKVKQQCATNFFWALNEKLMKLGFPRTNLTELYFAPRNSKCKSTCAHKGIKPDGTKIDCLPKQETLDAIKHQFQQALL